MLASRLRLPKSEGRIVPKEHGGFNSSTFNLNVLIWTNPAIRLFLTFKTSAHLCISDSVNSVLQSFVGITLDDFLDETAASPQRLLHAHAQVVVGFLRCQILQSKPTVSQKNDECNCNKLITIKSRGAQTIAVVILVDKQRIFQIDFE